MNEALLVFGMALVTFLIRYPMLVLVGRVSMPYRVLRALRFVPVAALTAITVPAVLIPPGHEGVYVGLDNSYLVGGIVAVIVSWRTKNLLLTIVIGMVAFFLWRAILGAM